MHRVPDVRGRQRALHRPGAHEPSGHRIHLDAEARRLADLLRQLTRDHGAKLHHRVVALLPDAAGANDQTLLVQREIGRVEEVDLADLGVEWVDAQGGGTPPRSETGTVSFSSTLSASLMRLISSACFSSGKAEDLVLANEGPFSTSGWAVACTHAVRYP